MMPDYLCQEKQHNKLWRYTINGLSVTTEYGRVGQSLKATTKAFGSATERDRFVATKIREKEKKGYVLATQEKVKQEQTTAKQLGTQYKISRMLFVSQKGTKLTQITNYDPKKFVYVEILNSWKKTITRLLLSKTQSFEITGGVSETNRTITYGSKTLTNSSFITAVRGVLRRLSEQVVEVIKTVKFAAVGARNLFDDDNDSPEAVNAFASILSQVDSAGVDTKVVSRFASMGARVLEFD